MSKKKVLFWDIETNPGLFYGWSMRYEPFYQLKGTSVSCVAYKWEHENKVHTIRLSKSEHLKDARDDKSIIEKMSKVINEADVMIAHNGDSFDWKKFNARVLHHNLPPLKKPKLVDTLKMVRSQMKFDSHKLGDLCKQLEVSLKIENEKNLFVKALTCWKSYKKLYKYCVGDVIALEDVYNKLKPYCKPAYHVGRLDGKDFSCASCGSEKIVKWGTFITVYSEKQRLRCKDCGFTGNVDVSSKKRKLTRGVI